MRSLARLGLALWLMTLPAFAEGPVRPEPKPNGGVTTPIPNPATPASSPSGKPQGENGGAAAATVKPEEKPPTASEPPPATPQVKVGNTVDENAAPPRKAEGDLDTGDAPATEATEATEPAKPEGEDAGAAKSGAHASEAAKPDAKGTETKPVAPLGPPLHSTLRESDFDHSACLLSLYMLGATVENAPAETVEGNRDCGIDRPIRVTEILPGVALDGKPLMRCETARRLAFWLRDSVRPATMFLPNSPRLTSIQPGSTYDCRGVVGGKSNATVSEHALGNAFDIASFTFDDGSTYTIEPRKDSGGMEEAFQIAIRGAACLYFTTVLGPGSNAAHDNHLHLDIKERKGGYRLCQ